MATTATPTNNELYGHEPVTRELLEAFNEASPPTSWFNRKKDGQYLGWAVGKFTGGKGGAVSEKVFALWMKGGKPVSPIDFKRSPACHIEFPPAPVKAFYVDAAAMLKFNDDVGRASQKAELQREGFDKELYQEYAALAEDLDHFFTQGLAEFLVNNTDHSFLNQAERDIIQNEGKSEAIKAIVRVIRNAMDHSYHQFRWYVPKRNALKQNYGEGPVKKICPHDEAIVSREEWNPFHEHMLAAPDPLMLNLMRIQLPDGKTMCGPADYHRLYAEGASAAMTLTIYGLHRRPDGQHSVSGANTGLQLITNGVPSTGNSAGVDMFAIRMAKRQRTIDSTE